MAEKQERKLKPIDSSEISSEHSEKVILGAVQVDNNLMFQVDKLNPTDLSNIRHQVVLEAYKALFREGKTINSIFALNWITANKDSVFGWTVSELTNLMMGLPQFSDLYEYIDDIKECTLRREINKQCALAIQKTKTGLSPKLVIEELTNGLNYIDDKSEVMTHQKAVDLFIEKIDDWENVEKVIPISGIPELDNRLAHNGFVAPDLTFFAGESSIGKTAFLYQIAFINAVRGMKVLFVPLEMDATQLVKRMVARYSHYANKNINPNLIRTDKQTKDQLIKIALYIRNLPIFYETCYTDGELIKKVKYHKKYNNIDLAIVDHLNLMTCSTAKHGTKNDALGAVARTMKMLAKSEQIPVVSGAQITVDGQGKIKIRDTGEAYHHADNVGFLVEDENRHPDHPNTFNVYTYWDKQRDGDKGEHTRVDLEFQRDYQRLVSERMRRDETNEGGRHYIMDQILRSEVSDIMEKNNGRK